MILPWQGFNFFLASSKSSQPEVAISACLNGEALRYDGTAKLLETTSTLLPRHLTLLPICPEVGAGLGVPRAPVQLVKTHRGLEAMGREDANLNVTAELTRYRQQSLKQQHKTLCGYIFKSRSPSCGLNSSPIYNQQGEQIAIGSGLQASYFQQQMPWLVLTEESRLQTDIQCQQFIQRCLLSWDIQRGAEEAGLVAVHRHYRFLIKTLDGTRQELLENAAKLQPQRYREQFLSALCHTPM